MDVSCGGGGSRGRTVEGFGQEHRDLESEGLHPLWPQAGLSRSSWAPASQDQATSKDVAQRGG